MNWTGWVVVEVGRWRYILGGWTIFRGGWGWVKVRSRYILSGWTTFRVGRGRWRYILGEWGVWRFSIAPTKNVSVKKLKNCKSFSSTSTFCIFLEWNTLSFCH